LLNGSNQKLQRKLTVVNVVPGFIFTTSHFLCFLWMGHTSLCVCPWPASPTYCNVTLLLIGSNHKLQRKWTVVNVVPGCAFTTPHFLCFLWMGHTSLCVCPWQASPAHCNVTLLLNGSNQKLQRKLTVVNVIPGCAFTTPHFLCYLRISRTSLCVCPWPASPVM